MENVTFTEVNLIKCEGCTETYLFDNDMPTFEGIDFAAAVQHIISLLTNK